MIMQHATRQRKFASAFMITLFFILFSGLLPLSLAYAQSNGDLPSRGEVQNQLDALEKQKNLSSRDKLAQQDLTQTLEMLEKLKRVKEESSDLDKQIEQAPVKMREATRKLEALRKPQDDADTSKQLARLSLSQLEERLGSALEDLQNAQSSLSTFNSQLVSLQTQPERVQNAMSSATRQLQQVRNRLSGTAAGDTALRATQQALLLTQQAVLNAQIEQQRKSLEGNTALQDSLQKQKDYTTAWISQLEHQLKLLQSSVNNKRLTLTERTAREAVTPEEASNIQKNPLVKQELDLNHQISQRLIDATQNGNDLVQRNIQVKTWLDRALQSERNLKEQIAVLKGSLLLSRILYQQQQTLPSADQLEDMTNRIADLRLEQFDINQQRDELFQRDAFVERLIQLGKDKEKAQVNDEVRDALLEVADMRRELLDQLNKQLGNQLMLAINLQMNQQQLMNASGNLQKILTQQIFWVTSNKPMDWEWFKAFPQALKDQIAGLKDLFNRGKAPHALGLGLGLALPLLLVAGLVRWRFRWLKERLKTLSDDVGQLRKDSQLHTPMAMLINLVRTLPVSLLILGVGVLLLCMRFISSDLMWDIAKELALFWTIFGLSWRVLEKEGVAVRHFMISPMNSRHYRRQMVRVSLALLPLLVWAVIGGHSPLHLMNDVLGQFVIFLNLLLLAGLMLPMWRDAWRDKESHTIRLVVISILLLVPIGLLVLTATGYFYTTLRLAHRWIDTVYLVIIWNLLYQTVLRGLSVAARRIAWRRALARREAMTKEGEEGGETVIEEEPPLGLDQVNQQTLRLTTLAMFALFGLVFWAIWSDLITVFTYLDSIVLWEYSSGSGGSAVTKSVTMGSMLIALISFMLAWVLIRNLPGLLEVLILSRLKMRQGSSYAITTILNYVIIATGAIAVLGSLGISWDKLQWMAAGLSVGLGFGLQEVFGNFIAGLMILFERPVRIGDTITIGTYSGTVSKIRIRATTLTDFDHKEIIVPNKAFVTERLINWSLSDTVTRVVVKLGVAYGSDLEKVKKILYQSATDHPKVMHDPAPEVFFLAFGQSSLDHELRFYVRTLLDRNTTLDEVNRTIEQLCREHEIDVAFNRLEVHMLNDKGDEQTVVKRGEADDGEGEAPSV
ncbi:mechanosensitive channel MscK [Jejubacter calystegiae]|uniref:Mechanosensitive channel MscK n=2 Tax=Jejubacter calystegiae TaxID=2579935 RepID=A0A4P8YHI4_9ENTR|nr:mechanosensitive channel MscK [Jejubacter calystegiae]QCT20175.1 mechanosensitive channel MscK [Jejubacter calystegiae]